MEALSSIFGFVTEIIDGMNVDVKELCSYSFQAMS